MEGVLSKLKNFLGIGSDGPESQAVGPQAQGGAGYTRIQRTLTAGEAAAFDSWVLGEMGGVTDEEGDAPSTAVDDEARRMNLMERFGFRRSKQNMGKAEGLVAMLSSIYHHFQTLVREEKEITEQERSQLEGQMSVLRQKEQNVCQNLEVDQKETERRLGRLSERERELQTQQHSLRHETPMVSPSTRFSVWMLGLFLLVLTGFIWIFYTNAIYAGFFARLIDLNDPAQVQQEVLNPTVFKREYLIEGTNTVLPILAPIFLLAMASLVHGILEWKGNIVLKGGMILGLLALTVVADSLIAKKVADHHDYILTITGHPEMIKPWYQDSVFLMILLMGFVASIIWGFLLHYFLRTWEACHPETVRKSRLAHLDKDLQTLSKERAEVEAKGHEHRKAAQEAIADLSTQIKEREAGLLEKVVVIGSDIRLRQYLAAFFAGWMRYVNALGHRTGYCQNAYNAFIAERFGPGGSFSSNGKAPMPGEPVPPNSQTYQS